MKMTSDIIHMTSRNNTAPQKKNLKPNTQATTGKRPNYTVGHMCPTV